MNAKNRSLRPATIPTGKAMSIEMTTATVT